MSLLTWFLPGIVLVVAAGFAVVGDWGNWVYYSQSSGANEVHLPVGYWLVAGLWMLLVARLTRQPLRAVAPLATITAFFVHVLMLLAAMSPILQDAAAFTTPAYQLYARVFCAGALAAGVWVSVALLRLNPSVPHMRVAVLYATLFFAQTLLYGEPVVAILGGAAGVIGLLVRDRTSVIAKMRVVLANERVFLLVVFVIALALRLLYLQRVMSNPGYLETGADGPVYDELAWSIAQGRGIRASFTERLPLLLLDTCGSSARSTARRAQLFCRRVRAGGHRPITCLMFMASPGIVRHGDRAHGDIVRGDRFPLLFAAAAIGHPGHRRLPVDGDCVAAGEERPLREWPW